MNTTLQYPTKDVHMEKHCWWVPFVPSCENSVQFGEDSHTHIVFSFIIESGHMEVLVIYFFHSVYTIASKSQLSCTFLYFSSPFSFLWYWGLNRQLFFIFYFETASHETVKLPTLCSDLLSWLGLPQCRDYRGASLNLTIYIYFLSVV